MKITAYTSTWKETHLLEENKISFHPDVEEEENELINLYPQYTEQIWEGFGGAVTESAGYVYSKMSDKQKKELLQYYFGTDGLRCNRIRLAIDSCDFSLGEYEAAPDCDLEKFSMERAGKYTLPLLEDIRRTAAHPVKLMLTPWSPPAAFKTNGDRKQGGKLKPEYRAHWAEYLCRYIKEYQDRGFEVERISLQNEPKAVQIWDSCIWTAEEERDFLVNYMKPALRRHGMEDVEVFIWDHNKERILERTAVTLYGEGKNCADGVAFHWYSGDHFRELEMFHKLFPDKKLILSESCLEYSKLDVSNPAENAERAAHEIIGDMNNGMNAFYDWNMLLDQNGGPNYVKNYCHAPFLYHLEEKTLKKESLYDCFWHFAQFILPGSRQILSTSYTDRLETTAFQRPDGKIAVIVLNKSIKELPVKIRMQEQIAELNVPPHSLTTGLIE